MIDFGARSLAGRLYKPSILPRARLKFNRLLPYLNGFNKLLDIGTGNGGLAHLLHHQGFQITSIDVQDQRFYSDFPFRLYDGHHLNEFEQDVFDCALFVTVLHHLKHQEELIKEAMRCSSHLLIMEDVYSNEMQKQLTYFTDSLVNFEFRKHPHSNRNSAEWQQLFSRMGLKVLASESRRTALFFRQDIYLLQVPD